MEFSIVASFCSALQDTLCMHPMLLKLNVILERLHKLYGNTGLCSAIDYAAKENSPDNDSLV